MNKNVTQRYTALSTEELVNIVFVDRLSYETEAIELATRELQSRGVNSQTAYETVLTSTREETARTQKEAAEALAIRNTAPLETKDKALFFILGMFPVPLILVIASFYIILQRNKRGTEKTSQSLMWLFFGFCVPVGAMILYFLVRGRT